MPRFCQYRRKNAPQTEAGGLRKDYAYLFERFFYFLEDSYYNPQGVIIFDEFEKSKSHILVGQAHRYFKETATGRHRASLIVPEPFFVHSDLTTGVQIADLVAYIVSWGFRLRNMTEPKRDELASYVRQVANLHYRTTRERQNAPHFGIWSFCHITDLRTQAERQIGK